MKIILVGGARPNFMKIAPVYHEMKNEDDLIPIIVHTGQHYDDNMSDKFFRDLELPHPDIYLGVGSGTHAQQTARVMREFEKICMERTPDLVIVVGDVNSTLACSLVASKLHIPVGHIEAGLRSFDRKMPEEINRIVTDSISNYLFTTCKDANENLRKEGIPEDKIYFVGNVMIDTLNKFKEKAAKSNVIEKYGLEKNGYAVMTLHRPSNVDEKGTFKNISEALEQISKEIEIVFPVHPRTKKQIEKFGFGKITEVVRCIEPLGYINFLGLMMNSRFVITDSGGIQEETTTLELPCLTLRENTERPVTITEGTNVLVGTEKQVIITEAKKILERDLKKGEVPKYWDGKTARRIKRIIRKKL